METIRDLFLLDLSSARNSEQQVVTLAAGQARDDLPDPLPLVFLDQAGRAEDQALRVEECATSLGVTLVARSDPVVEAVLRERAYLIDEGTTPDLQALIELRCLCHLLAHQSVLYRSLIDGARLLGLASSVRLLGACLREVEEQSRRLEMLALDQARQSGAMG